MTRAYITDAQVERACTTLKRAIEAAENSNQAGEDFVVAAAVAPALLEALEWLVVASQPDEGGPRFTPTIEALNIARAAIAKARGQ